MRFGRRRQPLVRHRGRLSLRCKNDYPPPPQPPPRPLSGPKGGIAPRPLSAHARRGGPVVGPPQPPLPWGPLSGPRGEGGHLYCSPWALFRSQWGGIFCLQTCSNHFDQFLTQAKRSRPCTQSSSQWHMTQAKRSTVYCATTSRCRALQRPKPCWPSLGR